MKIQYCSDLHLEFPENKKLLEKNPIKPVGDTLILAGDIVPFAVLDQHLDFFKYLSDNFKTTYWLPGNHEYYHSDAISRSGSFTENILDNVHLVNNQVIKKNNTRFIFTTLWTQISKLNEWWIRKGMSDFHVIKFNNKLLSPDQYNQLHQDCNNFLHSALQNENPGQTIVVTHHVPTLYNYPAKYRGNTLNEAFAVELYDLIADSGISYWIYGHSHANTPQFKIAETIMLTNQLGYVTLFENAQFRYDAVIHEN